MEKMTKELGKLMDKYVSNVPVQKVFNLPKLNKVDNTPKLKLPKLNKV